MRGNHRVTAWFLVFVLVFSLGTGTVMADNHESDESTVESAAVELRSEIDRILSEHTFGTITLMRKIFDGEPDVEQVKEVVNGNNEDLRAGFSSLYGEESADEFMDGWVNHVALFEEYATAAANDDHGAMQNAMDSMMEAARQLGKLQAELSEGHLTEAAVTEMLIAHEEQIAASFDAYVAGNYPTSYAMQSEAMAFSVNTMSKTLSAAFADQFPDEYDNTKAITVAGNLRSDLNLLLAEHFALAGNTMQKHFLDAPDFEASLTSLNENTAKLAAAMSAIYGEAGGAQFSELWNSHNEYYLQYVEATAADNAEEKEAAVANLEQFRDDIAQFLEEATDGILEAGAVADSAQMHIDTTLGTFDSFAEEDYAAAWETAREGYAHMFMKAKDFSAAFVEQFPEKFAGVPAMPDTGFGGMANTGSMNWILWALPFLVFASFIIFPRRRQFH